MFGWLKRIIPRTFGGGYRDLPLEQGLMIQAKEELVAVQSHFPNTADYQCYLRAIVTAVQELLKKAYSDIYRERPGDKQGRIMEITQGSTGKKASHTRIYRHRKDKCSHC